MIKFTVLYGHPEDPDAFERYYAEVHMPLVEKIRGATWMEAAKVVGTSEGGVPAHYRMFEFWFDSLEQMQEALESEEGQAAVADIPNYATGGVTTLISEV